MTPKYFWDGDDEFSWVNIGEGVLQKKKRIKKKRIIKKKRKPTKKRKIKYDPDVYHPNPIFKGLGSKE